MPSSVSRELPSLKGRADAVAPGISLAAHTIASRWKIVLTSASSRHVCFVVEELNQTERYLASAGIEILPAAANSGIQRFYIREPAAI